MAQFKSILNSGFIAAALVLTTFTAATSHAYYTTMDNGELLKPGKYRASAETNIMFNRNPGLNLVARADMGFNDSSNFRAILGGGAFGFQTGVFYKWIPIPDLDDQPAIGGMGGFIFARDSGENYLSWRIHPLVSKKFETSNGMFIPHASLPFGMTLAKKTTFPLQLALGSEWIPVDENNWSFMAEIGLEINESYSYVSACARYAF